MYSLDETRSKLTSSPYSVPAYLKPCLAHWVIQSSGVRLAEEKAKPWRSRSFHDSATHPWYDHPAGRVVSRLDGRAGGLLWNQVVSDGSILEALSLTKPCS